MIVLSTLLLPAMIVRFYQGWFQMLLIDLPLFLASSCSISGFYLAAAARALSQDAGRAPFSICRSSWPWASDFPCATPRPCSKPSSAVQIRIRAHAQIQHRGPERHLAKEKSIAIAPAGCPTSKSLLGLYFAATIVYAIQNENYVTVPFLLLFVWGYLYTGLMSLGQASSTASASACNRTPHRPRLAPPPLAPLVSKVLRALYLFEVSCTLRYPFKSNSHDSKSATLGRQTTRSRF